LNSVLEVLSGLLLLGGAGFAIIAALGMLRLPDFYSRVHGAGILDTLGAGLIVLGLILQAGFTLVSVKLALILLCVLITGPTATHALARAALHSGHRPVLDEEQASSKQ